MPLQGSHRLGPDNATLSVRTGRTGVAAKAGHDLLLHVTAWEATLELGEHPGATLTADAASLRVVEGTGGVQALGSDDKESIRKTIDDEVLQGREIAFRSTEVLPSDGGVALRGDLTLAGETRPIAFDLLMGEDGALRAGTVVRQSDWGLTPYSTLFGTLKVADEVEVVLEARV